MDKRRTRYFAFSLVTSDITRPLTSDARADRIRCVVIHIQVNTSGECASSQRTGAHNVVHAQIALNTLGTFCDMTRLPAVSADSARSPVEVSVVQVLLSGLVCN